MTLKTIRPQLVNDGETTRTVGEGGGGIWFSCHAKL